MRSPGGWVDTGQTPAFDEFTVVHNGMLRVTHKGGTIAKAGDPNLKIEDGSHPVSYVAKGTHANYLKPGTYEIEGTEGVATDTAAAAPAGDVFDTEDTLVMVGTRAKPLDGQVFIRFWGRWGQVSNIPETSGVRRHFP